MFTDSGNILCLQQISKEKLEFTFEFSIFLLFCEIQHLLDSMAVNVYVTPV